MKMITALLTVMLTCSVAFAQQPAVYQQDHTAINGYDAVAYFTENKPVKGAEAYVYNWQGANWLFVSKQHLDSFTANPEKYAPQFGGYCAYGMSEGYKAPTQATAWTIVNSKLYLNYNEAVREEWKKQLEVRIKKAAANWPSVKDK